MLLAGLVQAASADTAAVIDEATAKARCTAGYPGTSGADPLSPCQWDMRVINAGAAQAKATGKGVKVGVIDGGVDFTHPDLAGGIDVEKSCSFIYSTTPTADPQEIANGDCSNKAAVQDLQGHGTHVATTIAGRGNGIGIVGVAPEATIVALKACTIAGFCFADSVAAALRYAGDQRLDVVNLSLFADPYLYYCANEAGQRAIIKELQCRPLRTTAGRGDRRRGWQRGPGSWPSHHRRYQPRLAARSAPSYAKCATIAASRRPNCPALSPCRLPVSIPLPATRTSARRWMSLPLAVSPPDALHSIRARAHSGWLVQHRRHGNLGSLAGVNRAVVSGGGRYVWISGTSMASPHAAGVAALIRQVHPDMPQGAVAALLRSSATPLSCPANWPAD